MPELPKSLCDSLNAQIRNELSSAYLYLDMSTKVAARNLKGTAHWLRLQWQEELAHAQKMIDYVIERGNEVALEDVSKPDFEFTTLTDVFEGVLRHEREITGSINRLYAQAAEHNDYAAQTFLQWFVTEQVEEENSAQDILDMLAIGGEQGPALLMVDRYLSQRSASSPEA